MKISFTPAASAFFLAGSNSSPCRSLPQQTVRHLCCGLRQGCRSCTYNGTADMAGSSIQVCQPQNNSLQQKLHWKRYACPVCLASSTAHNI